VVVEDDSDKKKIAFVLSLLEEGEARTWRTNYLKKNRNDTTKELDLTSTYANFISALDSTFKRANEEEEALFDLHRLKQRDGETAEQVITRFREKASLAGLDVDQNPRLAIDYLRACLHPKLVDNVAKDTHKPDDDFELWSALVIRYDNAYRKSQFLKNLRSKGTLPLRTQFSLPRTQRRERDPDTMDVDALSFEEKADLMKKGACFNCRKQGHHSRDCPTKKDRPTNTKKSPAEAARFIRSLLAKYSANKEEELRKAFEDLDEKDF